MTVCVRSGAHQGRSHALGGELARVAVFNRLMSPAAISHQKFVTAMRFRNAASLTYPRGNVRPGCEEPAKRPRGLWIALGLSRDCGADA
jgi:hypothetical protein